RSRTSSSYGRRRTRPPGTRSPAWNGLGNGPAKRYGKHGKRTDRGDAARSPIAFRPVEQFANGVQVPGVPGGLLQHVQHHPAQARGSLVEVGGLPRLVQRVGGNDLVRLFALHRACGGARRGAYRSKKGGTAGDLKQTGGIEKGLPPAAVVAASSLLLRCLSA